MKKFCFIIAAVLLMAGCAGVKINKVTSDNQEGIRFYRPHPYLLITRENVAKPDTAKSGAAAAPGPSTPSATAHLANKKPSFVAVKPTPITTPPSAVAPTTYIQIVWLPDKKENYAVQIKSGLGTVDSTIKLDNGWQLTQFGGKVDTKVPETITAASGFLQAITKFLPPGPRLPSAEAQPLEKEMLPPGLYRLEFDPTNGWITGAVRVVDFAKP